MIVTIVSFISIFIFGLGFFMFGIGEIRGFNKLQKIFALIVTILSLFLFLSSLIIFLGSLLYLIINPLPSIVPIIVFSVVFIYSICMGIILMREKGGFKS